MAGTVVSMGVTILDILGRYVTRIPDGQNIDLLDEIRLTVAGTAGGTAVDLAKLGANVIAMAAIGYDEPGNFIHFTMQKYGINVDHLVRKDAAQTSCTMLPIRPNGARPALHVPGTNNLFSLEDIDFDVLAQADFLHFGGTCLMAKMDGQPTAEVLKFAKEHGVVTTWDILGMPRPDLLDIIEPGLPYVDYFMPGLEEAEMITGLKNRKDIIQFFLDRGAKHTVFKMGGEGTSIGGHNMDEIRIPAYKAKVVDSTGCGDSYCAGFIVGLSMGWDLFKAGQLGAACGALVVSGLGSDAGIIDLEHTLEFMNTAETLPMAV
ncbi:MAG: sugar kinase [Chloroflexota bacterium]|nr:MAG: sugar kinase [Chloroflexota bacterium]